MFFFFRLNKEILFDVLFGSSEVIEKYKGKIQGLEKDVKDILKLESEEKEVNNQYLPLLFLLWHRRFCNLITFYFT